MDIRQPVSTIYGDHYTKFAEVWKTQVAQFREKFGTVVEEVRMPIQDATDVPILYVKKESIVEVLNFLKNEPGFEYGFMADLTAVDEMPAEPRFEVVYNLYSVVHHYRIRVKARVAEGDSIPTAISVWPSANWPEREVWDMFGIQFSGHPDLRRILMDDRWVGHPLRKDYPLRGYQIFPTPPAARPELLD